MKHDDLGMPIPIAPPDDDLGTSTKNGRDHSWLLLIGGVVIAIGLLAWILMRVIFT